MERSTRATAPLQTDRQSVPSWEPRLERLVQSIRRYRPEDREALRQFQKRFFGGQARQLDDARFRWLFEANPWMEEAAPEVWLCEREEGIVGQQSGIVHRLKIGTTDVRSSWAVDLMVDPAWRLRGVGPALSERHARNHPAVIGLGATDQLHPSLLRSGWVDLGPIPSRIRPLRMSELEHWQRRRPMRARLARFLVPPLKWTADRWGDVVRRRTRVHIESVDSFDTRADELWRLVATEHPVIAYRNASALRWRFDLSPDAPRYSRFLLLHRGAPAGYFVLRDGSMFDDPVSFLVDYLCPLRLMDALLTHVTAACWERGVGAVVCNSLDPRASATFTRAGFLSHWDVRRLLLRTQPHLASLHSLLSDLKSWFVTQADSDWDHPAVNRSDRLPDSL